MARFSGLTTRGRCLLAGGAATAACSVVLDERDLLRIGAFVMLLPLLAALLAARTRRMVRVTRELSPARLSVGGPVEVDLHIRGSALVGALRLADTVPDAAGPVAGAWPRFTVHRLSGRDGAHLSYPLRPLVRGVHAIGPLHAAMTDPLALAEFERTIAGPDRLTVLPRVFALHGLPAAVGAGEGTSGAALAHQGQGSSDVLVRPYRHGDEMRRVHWRSTARHDELMVRLEERPWRAGTTVLLDRRDAAHRGRGADSSLEFAVSMAASICAHLIGRGEPVRLVTEDGTPLPEPGASGIDPVLDALAALRPSARADLTGPDLPSGTDLIAVLGALSPGHHESLAARRPTGGYAVLLDTATWDPADGRPGSADASAHALRVAGWTAAVAVAGSSPDRVWEAL